ncbi:neurofilament medium polypeptide-like [Pempheris klunzingeri]|uniref:neurofilament medium polypeptide-like n=1 Tax=Pempheris klunzingeri TaxID=3127111 RepID=UPI00397EF1A4
MEVVAKTPCAHKLAKRLRECNLEKEVLGKQVEQLKVRLESAENHNAYQEEKVRQLTAQLEEQKTQKESLQEQLLNLKNKLPPAKPSSLQEKVGELSNAMLQDPARLMEQSMRPQPVKELQEAGEEPARQNNLMEMVFNKGEGSYRELERLSDLSDEEAPNIATITIEARNDISRKIGVEKLWAELQLERERSEALHRELQRLCEINERDRTELKAEREKISELLGQLEEKTIQVERASEPRPETSATLELQAEEEEKEEGQGLQGDPKEEEKEEGQGLQGDPKEEEKEEGQGLQGDPKEEEKEEGQGLQGDPKEEEKEEGQGLQGDPKEEEKDASLAEEPEAPTKFRRMLCWCRRPKRAWRGRNTEPRKDATLEEDGGDEV